MNHWFKKYEERKTIKYQILAQVERSGPSSPSRFLSRKEFGFVIHGTLEI